MTPQFNRKEVVRELLGEEPSVSLLFSCRNCVLAEKTDKEIFELYKKLKNEHKSRSIITNK